MRKIQFRGKTVSGEMIYGDLQFGINGNPLISCFEITPPTMSDPCGDTIRVYYEVAPETIGQFTGLIDKNGVEIYDGDIVRQTIEDKMEEGGVCIITIEIKFENGCFGWIGETTGLFHSFQSYEDMLSYEVVGNIFDNPEMLKS